ncbi:MAG TPA: hypothetical protein DIW36_07140 [Ruminococcaceae bacterium]|nr:hypothetical protein [Oscillospiraceae bacterium]
MRTIKKTLSVLLCLCLMLSVVATGFTAIAADKTEAVTKFSDAVTAYSGKLSVADPTEEDLAAYEKLVTDYKKLSQNEIESIDVLTFDIFYHLVLDRERQISIKNNPDIKAYDKRHYANAAAQAVTTLGFIPAYVDKAVDLGKKLNNKALSLDDKKAAWTEADANARIMVGGYSSSNGILSTALKGSTFKGVKLIVDLIYNDLLKANPAPTKPKSPGSAPKASKYEQGENDPQYKADFAEWLTKAETYNKAYAVEFNHKGELYLEAFDWIVSVDSAYKPVIEAIKDAKEAKEAYDNGGAGATAKAAAAAKLYEALSEREKAFYNECGYYLYATAVDNITSWTYKSYTPKGLYDACVDIGNARYVDYFTVVIENITEPYNRADIEAAKAAYEKVPQSLKSKISVDTMEKYNAILASIAPDEPTGERPNVERMETTKVKYPAAVSGKKIDKTIDNVQTLLYQLLDVPSGGMSQLVSEGVYTNYTVALLAKKLYPLIGGISSMLAMGPEKLAAKLDKESCAGAIEALNAAANTLDEDGKKVDSVTAWEYVEVKDGDFGFKDGDKEGFLDAAAALFRPLSLVTMVITFENKADKTKGTYTYGAYEDLIPIFEALGIENVMSSDEYTKAIEAVSSSDDKMDRRIRPILAPIFELVDSVANAKAPLNALMELLPKVAYAVDSGLVNTQVQAVIGKLGMGLSSKVDLDLTTSGLFDLVAPLIEKIEIKAAETDEQGNETVPAVLLGLKLDKEKFTKAIHDLAGCGKYTANQSVARGKNWYVSIDGNARDAFVVFFRYLHSELSAKGNKTALKNAIDNAGLNFAQRTGYKLVISLITTASADSAFRIISSVLPTVNFFIRVSKIFSK